MYRSATRVAYAKTNSIPYPFPPVKRKSKNTKNFSFLLTGANFFDYNEGGFFAYGECDAKAVWKKCQNELRENQRSAGNAESD